MNIVKLEEVAKSKGKLLLIEKQMFQIEENNIEIFDKPRLIENISGKFSSTIGILRNVPVTKYTENLNKRIYCKELWMNVKKSRLAEGSLSLADHPDDEGSVLSITGVWHNFRLTEKIGYADLYLVGDLGKLLMEVVRAGGKIGISTVGYGELMEDSVTVDPSSYELERLGDVVLKPSQETYITMESIQESYEQYETNKFYEENTSKQSKINLLESFGNTNNVKEEIKMDKEIKLQESAFKNQIRIALREGRDALDSKDASIMVKSQRDLKELQEMVPDSLKEQADKIDSLLFEIENGLKHSFKDKESKLQEIVKENKTLMENSVKASKVIEDFKKKYNTLMEKYQKDVVVGNQNVNTLQEDLNSLLEDRQLMEKDINKLLNIKKQYSENESLMKKDINYLLEERKTLGSNLKSYKEHISQYKENEKLMKEDIDYLFEENTQYKENERLMKEDIDYLVNNKKILEENEKFMLEDIDQLVEDRELMESDINRFENITKQLKKNITLMEKDINQMMRDRSFMENDINILVEDRKLMEKDIKQLITDRQVMEEDIKHLLKENSVLKQNRLYEDGDGEINEMEPYTVDDDVIEDLDNDPIAQTGSLENEVSISVDPAMEVKAVNEYRTPGMIDVQESLNPISTFYNKEVKKHPGISQIKENILSSKTLVEAAKKINRYLEKLDDRPIRLTEAFKVKDADWLGNRK